MSKPFDLEAAKAGKKFKRRGDNVAPEKVAGKCVIGINKKGQIVWEYDESYNNNCVFTHYPEELEMIPEKREKKFLLVNQQGKYILAHEDTPENRAWCTRFKYPIFKEFTVEWEE